MSDEENKAIVLLTELRGLYEATAEDYNFRGTLSILVDEDDSDAIKTILELVETQQKEIEQLANGIRVLGTNPDITTEEIIKEFTEKPITEEYMEEFKSRYISKDKVLKAMGYEENDEEYERIKQDDEKILSVLDTMYSEFCRLEDIEDRKVQVELEFVNAKRDKYWQDKIREVLEKERKKQKERTDISLALHSQYISLIDKIKKQLLEE